MTERLVVVGSTTFPLSPEIGGQVVDIIREMEPKAILTRPAEGFDEFIVRLAGLLDIPCIMFPSTKERGNWERDIAMVEDADAVIGFIAPDAIHEEMTGTQHVLESALTAKKPTRAYTEVDGRLVWAGELP